MNPLTLVKRIYSLNSKEVDLGISNDASWHANNKDTTYIFIGGIPLELNKGQIRIHQYQYCPTAPLLFSL